MVNHQPAPTVYIALGSNLGERQANLENAADALSPEVIILEHSPVYETPPWGFLDQPQFLNQVLKTETTLSPVELLAYLKSVERQMGREISRRYGPRSIDLDIIFYGDLILDTLELTIPHQQMANRAFVLKPLADLDPELRHPLTDLTVGDMLSKVDTKGIRLFAP